MSSDINLRIKAVETLTGLSSNIIHSEFTTGERLEYLLCIFSIFINSGNFNASSVAEDVTFELFKYSKNHDRAFQKWRNDILNEFEGMEGLLDHIERENETRRQVEIEKEEVKEVPNILDLSSMPSDALNASDIPKEKVEKWSKALSEIVSDKDCPEQLSRSIIDSIEEEYNSRDMNSTWKKSEFIQQILSTPRYNR